MFRVIKHIPQAAFCIVPQSACSLLMAPRIRRIMLQNMIQNRIFLDSDDVSKLDAIMDVTAWDCENVVVVMTSETLKRMWCAAEIASAWAGESCVAPRPHL